MMEIMMKNMLKMKTIINLSKKVKKCLHCNLPGKIWTRKGWECEKCYFIRLGKGNDKSKN